MATRVGLIRARGHSCRAQLVHGQLQSSISGVRLLARLSSASSRSTALKGSASGSSSSAPLGFRPLAHRHQYPASSIFLGRRDSGSGGKALFSSTTATRPAHEEGAAQDSDPGHSSSSSSGSKPGRKTFDGGNNDDRLARLDDGDKYEDFFDLRLAEAETIFPEGLAGGGQGALERAMAGSTSTALLRREAADALIHSLDAFAPEDGGAAPPFGIEGTSSENWRKASEARQYGSQQDGGGSKADAATAAAAAAAVSPDNEDQDYDGDDDDIIGDVTAAAEEGAAAAAAAAEAVKGAARAAAAAAAAAAAGGEGPEQEEGKEGEDKKVLGSGPVWEEMKALAESKRKPLKGVRRVVIQPGQRSYLLTGRRGSGKSCVLNHAVLHARSTGWIVLFVPDGRNLVQKGIYCQPSPVLEGLYDLPVQSMKRLKTLREAHGDQLKNISIKDPEVLGRHEGAKTLLDVMDMGLADQEHAGTAHYDVMRELLATTEAKVMLAIDEYNELFQMSQWHYGDNKASAALEAPHLTATLPLLPPLVSTGTGLAFADDSVAALANPEVVAERKRTPAEAGGVAWMSPETGAACLPPPPANGIVVCAVSGRYPPVKRLRKNKKWVPFEATAGRLAQAVSIPVEPYTRREFLRVLKHYARVEEVVNEPLDTMEVAKVHAKSDSLPEHVFDTCRAGRYRTAVHEQ
ncbi:unnamed protein product [Ectocarpus sp. 6 AP-2014]